MAGLTPQHINDKCRPGLDTVEVITIHHHYTKIGIGHYPIGKTSGITPDFAR